MSIKAGLFAVAACASLCFATAANADAQFFFDGLGLNATVTTGSTLDAARRVARLTPTSDRTDEQWKRELPVDEAVDNRWTTRQDPWTTNADLWTSKIVPGNLRKTLVRQAKYV